MCRTRLYICSAIGIDGNHKSNKMTTQTTQNTNAKFTDLYHCYFINEKTKGTNINFVRANSLENAKQYFQKAFGKNLISVHEGNGMKTKR